jgi:hypothetical protein
MKDITADAYPLMAAAGYVFTEGRVSAPGAAAGDHITDERTLTNIEGRLDNIAYMARAIDLYVEGRSDAEPNLDGTKQFMHLIDDASGFAMRGWLYVALRRFQRMGRLDALRAGLGMLFAAEKGIMSTRDAVQALAPDLVQMHDTRDDEGGKALDRQRQLPEPVS